VNSDKVFGVDLADHQRVVAATTSRGSLARAEKSSAMTAPPLQPRLRGRRQCLS